MIDQIWSLHCTDVGLVETKVADDQVPLYSSNGYVPYVMQASVPVTFVWDNGTTTQSQ